MAGTPASTGPIPPPSADAPISAGYGTLRQEQITLGVASRDVQFQITPLDRTLIRLTAPDTEQRLEALRARVADPASPDLWLLISVHTEAPGGADFDPMDVELSSGGLRYRAEQIVGLSPEWGLGRLQQRTTRQALYRFPAAVDPWRALEVRIGGSRSNAWSDRLPMLDAERARVRARSGGYWSSPNFLILR